MHPTSNQFQTQRREIMHLSGTGWEEKDRENNAKGVDAVGNRRDG